MVRTPYEYNWYLGMRFGYSSFAELLFVERQLRDEEVTGPTPSNGQLWRHYCGAHVRIHPSSSRSLVYRDNIVIASMGRVTRRRVHLALQQT